MKKLIFLIEPLNGIKNTSSPKKNNFIKKNYVKGGNLFEFATL